MLHQHDLITGRVAQARLDIDASRLVVLNAAIKIDAGDAKYALREIAEAKIMVPKMLGQVVDDAVQIFGAAGVSQDTPLAAMWANARTMRLVDGPDEVHLLQLGRREYRRSTAVRALLEKQKGLEQEFFRKYGVVKTDKLALGWTSETKPKL